MPVKKLREFLNKNKVKFVAVSHSPAFTAQEIAASAHVPGKELAKTVMVKVDGKMAMAALPASCHVDFEKLAKTIKAKKVKLADEKDFQDLFGECEVGAMPPFGNLYDMEVYVAEELSEDEEIAFNAGSHTELIRMKYADFERLVKPKVVKFTCR
jgi:Ala-tRNA(Pro) deacylase